jgi:glucose/arabinose dehydrogenase
LRSLTLTPAFGGRRFGRPVEIGPYPGGRLFLAEQEGLVSLLATDGTTSGALLDIRPQVSRAGNEEGLLSVALDPGFPGRPYVYAYYSVAGGQRRTRLARFEVASDVAAPASEKIILEQAQPFENHNGGAIRFGPDGMLYLGLGDGGSGGDPFGNGQNLGTWLGKMLRIDVRVADVSTRYTVPADNPFIGTPGALPEIWAFGFRNPWRMAFDAGTGALWAGDVGQDTVEEIDVVRRGANYGWNRFEGDSCYRAPCPSAGMVAPVATYRHSEGCSVSGGVVYRGRAVPSLVGWYLYADFCSGRVWGVNVDGGAAVQLLGSQSGRAIASWGTDAAGEVYALVHGGAVLRVTGAE